MQTYDKMASAEFDTGTREPAAKEAKRVSVDYLYSRLNWDFIKMMAQIAHYAAGKYGAAEQYTESRLTGDREPINHVFEHARAYLVGEPHDHFQLISYQLAAVAYNAMMQYFYHICGTDTPNPYVGRELPPIAEQALRARANGLGPLTPLVPRPSLGPRPSGVRAEYDDPNLESKAKSFDRV